MFKELKVIKLLIILGLFVAILFKIDFLNLSVYQLYTDKFSYTPGEVVRIYSSSKAKYPIFKEVSVTDFNDKEKSRFDLDLSYSEKSFEQVIEQGEEIIENVELKLNEKFTPGLYRIANKFPLVVRGNGPSDITVVYPQMNNLLYQKIEEQNSFSLKLETTSLNRTANIDEYTVKLQPTLQVIEEKYKVNYITDLELEDYNNIKESKLLILYGKSTFWTPKMKNSFKSYVKNGGNVLLICSYLMNNVCWYDRENRKIVLYDKSRSQAVESYLGYNGDAPRYVVGSSYLFGGTTQAKTYNIIQTDHPVFEGMSSLSIHSELYSSIPVHWKDSLPSVNNKVANFYSSKVLAYNTSNGSYGYKGVKGIFESQPDTSSGTLLNLGTEDWCLQKDQQLIINSVHYLLR